jgi:NitT/TauT family transport system ATP-binding protein
LRFTNVSKIFGTGTRATEALTGVDLTLLDDEFVTLVGPSGCGKTTLLRLAAGLDTPSGGQIERSAERIAYVFQEPTLLPWRGALGNVELVPELRRIPREQRLAMASRALDTVGLSGFERHLPGQLSGGMRMRVSLARALVQDPELFLFDEPFGALDEITRLRLQDELQRLVHRNALFITHSVPEAVYLSDRVLVMSARPGSIVAEIEVPFDRPREARLRFDAEFGRVAARTSEALASVMDGEHG